MSTNTRFQPNKPHPSFLSKQPHANYTASLSNKRTYVFLSDKYYNLIFISIALIGISLGKASYAEPTDPCGGKVFSPDGDLCVTITAHRSPQPLKYVGTSTTVITRQEMERRGIRNVSDALKRVPGVAMARTGGFGSTTNIRLRGSDSGQVRVLIDGVTVNDPTNTENFFDFATLQTNNIDRIEVIRGPQSSVYGADTTGGVINIITRKNVKGSETNGFAEVGAHQTYRTGISHYGSTGKVHYGVSAQHYQTEGFSRISAGTEKDGTRSNDVKANLGFELTEQLSFDTSAGYSDDESDFDPSLTVDGPARQDKTTTYATAKTTLKNFDGQLRQSVKLSHFEVDRHFDEPLGFFRFSNFLGKRKQATYQGDLALRKRDTATIGLDWQQDKAITDTTTGGVTTPGLRNDIINRAIFGQYIAGITDSWTISVGGRRDDHSLFGPHTTHRFTTAYNIDATNTTLRATYGTGFKAPSIFQLFAASFGNPSLNPEESKAIDAGIEQHFLDHRLRINVTGFQSKVKNLITFDTGTFTYQNINRAKVKGVESSVAFDVLPELVVSGNHTYLLSEDETTKRSLPRRPKHTAGVAADLDVGDNGRIGTELLYVSSQWDRSTGTLRVKPHAIVNASGSYDINRYTTIYTDLENIFDRDYEEIVGLNAPGFTVFVGARGRY